ncbi:MAG: hypothetical protein JNN03_09655 [Rubrivivax sp.]|nr:hypothetical protein [Rubrivivax sp.]
MYLVRHDLALLQAPTLTPIEVPTPGLRLEELHADQLEALTETYRALGHRHPVGRPQRRFANGLRFGRLWLGGQLAGSLWVVHDKHRYLDEMNWRLPVSAQQFWLRDVFIAPALRGQRLFLQMLHLVARGWLPRFESAWSDVDWDNAASLRAHLAAGFVVRHRVRALDFNGRLRWRDPLVHWPGSVRDMQPARRWVWLAGERLRQHQAWIA